MQTGVKIGLGSVVVLIVLLVFIGIALVPALNKTKDYATTERCASNLHQIGLAIQLYEDNNNGLFPRTRSDNSDDPKPAWGTPYQFDARIGPVAGANPFTKGKAAPSANDVTAALFLLQRLQNMQAAVFVCPDSNQSPWDFGGGSHTANEWTNWQGNSGLLAHLSYSFQNPYLSRQAIDAGFQLRDHDPTFAIAADMNPGGNEVTSVNMHSTTSELRRANSYNHQGLGQNVLYADGHAEWQNNPFCGSMHDNIYTVGGPETPGSPPKNVAINRSPTGPMDSVLLPTAADIGYRP